MQFIDTHCHLYLSEFKDDIDKVLARAEAAGVKKFYLPAIDSSVTNDMLSLEKRYSGKCFAMAGLHPCSVNENFRNELNNVQTSLLKQSFAAIGEIGLDFYWSTAFTTEQYEVFETQMHWALEKKFAHCYSYTQCHAANH